MREATASGGFRRGTIVAAVLVAALAYGCGSSDSFEPPPERPLASKEGRIAFTRATSFSPPDFESAVYTIDADGSDERMLADEPGLDAFPAWSPDGEQLAFASERDGNWELYTMDADGSGQTRVTRTPGEDEAVPAWSPDGQRIAFVVNPVGENPTVHVMDLDGEHRGQLARGNWPSWSPNGRLISYTHYEADFDIFVRKPDGSEPRRLTGKGSDEEGAFSPDGRRIGFSSERREGLLRPGDAEIYVMNADGSNERRLTDIPGGDHWPPTWAPDGKRIAFTSEGTEGNPEIYLMNADGSGLTRLTDDPAEDTFPAWRP